MDFYVEKMSTKIQTYKKQIRTEMKIQTEMKMQTEMEMWRWKIGRQKLLWIVKDIDIDADIDMDISNY